MDSVDGDIRSLVVDINGSIVRVGPRQKGGRKKKNNSVQDRNSEIDLPSQKNRALSHQHLFTLLFLVITSLTSSEQFGNRLDTPGSYPYLFIKTSSITTGDQPPR
eukprot:scaffold29944_cov94-Skeletonema_dohrnii-CCMP3373.AAC.1